MFKKMFGYLSVDNINCEKWTVFQEGSLRKTVSFEEQIMTNVQGFKIHDSVYLPFYQNIFILFQCLARWPLEMTRLIAEVTLYISGRRCGLLPPCMLQCSYMDSATNSLDKYVHAKFRLLFLLSFKYFSQCTWFWKLGNILGYSSVLARKYMYLVTWRI